MVQEAKKMEVALPQRWEIVDNLFWQRTKRCWEAGDNFDLDYNILNQHQRVNAILSEKKKIKESTKLFWILLSSFYEEV